MNEILEMFKQGAFLSSVLAGFGITASIGIIALKRKGLLAFFTIALFSISAIVEIVCTYIIIAAIGALYGIGVPKTNEAWAYHFSGGMGLLLFLGLFLFLCGISLIGWFHSKVLGIITTVFSLLGFGFIVYFMISISIP